MYIVPVTAENFSDAVRVYTVSWRASHTDLCTPAFLAAHDEAYQAERLSERQADGWQLFAAYREEGCAGVVGIHAESGELGLLYVDPVRWGEGVGRALLQYATDALLRLNAKPFLTVLSTNTRAIRIYERAGYAFSGEERVIHAKKCISERKYIPSEGVCSCKSL